MAHWMSIPIGCEMCSAAFMDVDAERAAAGICGEDGKTWATLGPADRQPYLDKAIAAIEAIGGER